MRTYLPQPIGDGLTIRRATRADIDRLLAFMHIIFESDGAIEMGYLLEGAAQEREKGPNPDFRVEDVLLVVDRDEQIVSSLCLIPLEWQFGQSRLTIGQIEFVGTLPDYRGRGLVRAQIEIIHRWMAEREFPIGYIGGIPYFYRQFGYDYAIDISPVGSLTVAEHGEQVRLPEGVTVRPIEAGDVPALLALDQRSIAAADIRYAIPERAWRWLASGRPEAYEVESWIAHRGDEALGSAMFYRKAGEEALFSFTGEDEAAAALIATALAQPGVEKVLIDELADTPAGRLVAPLAPRPAAADGLYLRVNNALLAFQSLAGEFERRIAASEFAGLNRTLDLGLYRSGIQLVFDDDRLARVGSIAGDQDPKIGIPPDVLPKLLFGYRDIDQIAALYPDLRGPEDWELLRVLFPPLRAVIRWFY